MIKNILILEHPDIEFDRLIRAFRKCGGQKWHYHLVTTFEGMVEVLGSGLRCDLLVVNMDGDGLLSGTEVVRSIRKLEHNTPILAVAAEGDVHNVSDAINAGANDFLVCGADLGKRVSTMLAKVGKIFSLIDENRFLQAQKQYMQEREATRYKIVSCSRQMQELFEQVERFACVPRPILILGERGTGKELVARAIHSVGVGSEKTFIAINCASLSDSLLENELFGHEKGAYTGANDSVIGKFEQAEGGTLFLDEIGNVSLAFQQKILRVVEYGVYSRVGGSAELKTNIRLITATNADLQKKMDKGEFLRDLYDRLAFEVIEVPSLRERSEDIPMLANHFLEQFMVEMPGLEGKRIAKSALESLSKYDFPGNVRELKNIIERAACRDTTNEITEADLRLSVLPKVVQQGGGFYQQVEVLKQRLILNTLEQCNGNQAQAARNLGLSYHQFRYYLGKYT